MVNAHEHHHAKPIGEGEVAALHGEVTEGRHPHGAEAELICDCFKGVTKVALLESAGVEGNAERLAALRVLWDKHLEARQPAEA